MNFYTGDSAEVNDSKILSVTMSKIGGIANNDISRRLKIFKNLLDHAAVEFQGGFEKLNYENTKK